MGGRLDRHPLRKYNKSIGNGQRRSRGVSSGAGVSRSTSPSTFRSPPFIKPYFFSFEMLYTKHSGLSLYNISTQCLLLSSVRKEVHVSYMKSRFFSLFMSFILFVTFTTPYLTSTNANPSDIVFRYNDEDFIDVIVILHDIPEEAMYELFCSRYPEEYKQFVFVKENTDPIPNELLDESLLASASDHKRQIYSELYLEQNITFLQKYSSQENCIFLSKYSPMIIMRIPFATIHEMAEDEMVCQITEFVDEPGSSNSLSLANNLTRANYVRDTYGNSGSGVKIGMYEVSGVPDVTDSSLTQATIHKRLGTEPTNSHATKIARIMVGSPSGFAPNAILYCCSGSSNVDFYTGIEWLIDSGVNVINTSVNLGEEGTYGLKSQWVDHIAVKHDVHFVTTAGNIPTGSPLSIEITAPGMAYNAITVGAFDPGSATSWSQANCFDMASWSRYQESGSEYSEKPNIAADGVDFWDSNGTSFASPQVAATIAQLCSYNLALRYKQTSVGAILMASAARKATSVSNGFVGDTFGPSQCVPGGNQISEYEGAGVLDSRWARELVSSSNYWSATVYDNGFPYNKTVSLTSSSNTTVRICVFWLRQNSLSNHTSGNITVDTISNLDLSVFNPYGTCVATSSTIHSNFEIVQFTPTVSGNYTIRITDMGGHTGKDYIGIALWSGTTGS